MPTSDRLRLFERLEQYGFAEYEATSAWLDSVGYQIGKSALQEYVTQHRVLIETELRVARESHAATQGDERRFRMRCLEVAVQMSAPADVIAKAEELLRWVNREAPKSP